MPRDPLQQSSMTMPVERVKLSKGLLGAAVSTLLLSLASGPLGAQSPTIASEAAKYPSKPVRLIVPWPAGGSADNIGRTIAQFLAKRWGQPVVVENRAGAANIIGSEVVAKSPPDGHTLLIGTSPHTINATLYKKLPYDTATAFAPVMLMASSPLVLVAAPTLPANSLKELVSLARSRPTGINYATGGVGTAAHLAGESLKSETKAQFVHIPFKGGAPGAVAVMSGDVDVGIFSLVTSIGLIKSGKLKVIAIGSTKRSQVVPDVPTIAESGIPGFEASEWFAIFATGGTSPGVISKLHADLEQTLREPGVRERLFGPGFELIISTPDEFSRFLTAETARWAIVVRTNNLQAE